MAYAIFALVLFFCIITQANNKLPNIFPFEIIYQVAKIAIWYLQPNSIDKRVSGLRTQI